jgi:hypothetical protein
MRVLKSVLQHSGLFVLGAASLVAGVATVDAASPSKLYVAGDSIGVGIAEAAHLPSVASGSAPTSALAAQLERIPAGSTVIISTGTNDAVAGHDSAKLPTRSDLKLVYVGPPCVQTKWNNTQKRFAAFLAANTRHIALPCLVATRAKDGVHFTGAGYATLWATIRQQL